MTPKPHSLISINQRALVVCWMVLGVTILASSQLCSTIWAFSNPAPHHWDNALYLNHAYNDLWAYTNGGPLNHKTGVRGVWDSIINSDPYVPPAYRLASAPLIFWGVRMLPLLRAISLGFFWLTLFVIYRTCTSALDGPAGRAAGIIAAMLIGLYSEIGWSIRVYGTEHTLYFSTALMLFCLARGTRAAGKAHGTWIGLGFALGLGLLSKVSFVLLAGPALCVALPLVLLGRLPGLSLKKLIASAIIALAMAWPFYHRHLGQALRYAQEMMKFQRHSLHRRGLALLLAWVRLHINEGLGAGAAIIAGELVAVTLLAALITWAWRWTSRRMKQKPALSGPQDSGPPVREDCNTAAAQQTPALRYSEEPDRTPENPALRNTSEPASGVMKPFLSRPAGKTSGLGSPALSPASLTILIALAQGLVLPIFQLLFSQSDNVRHITPAYIPLTVAVTLAAGSTGMLLAWWSWPVLIACAAPAFVQLHRQYVPLTTVPDDVWDWEPIYQMLQEHNIQFPMIGHVGNGAQFCDPAITCPWERRGRRANSLWLWRTEEGDYDPLKVRRRLADRNVAITAPELNIPASGSMLADPMEQDNAHNAQFARAMQQDPDWQLAGKFPIGTVNRAQIWVYVRREASMTKNETSKPRVLNSKNETSKPRINDE